MPQQPIANAENNFTQGLKTEYTGMNFPENAATSTDNCVFTLIGNVKRREGLDLEANSTTAAIDSSSKAISSFIWENAGGDGNTRILVQQVGTNLHFYRASTATLAAPLSQQKLSVVVDLLPFLPVGGTSPVAVECQYASGNGYLFVFNQNLDPFYVTYTAGNIGTALPITIKVRDFEGITEIGTSDNLRPLALLSPHNYNLQNQGWSTYPSWSATTNTVFTYTTGGKTLTVQAGLALTIGDSVEMSGNVSYSGENIAGKMYGAVTGYAGTTLNVNITSLQYSFVSTFNSSGTWSIVHPSAGKIAAWFAAIGNYPSNTDVWWFYKNASNVFDPAGTINNVTINSGPAPKGFFILDVFNQTRGGVSGVPGVSDIATTARPRVGTWFQSRVWYSGVDAGRVTTGDNVSASWTERIYFSQIIENVNQFGKCYQTNDPTSEDAFDLLPTDGGVIVIPGCGTIYKLFPIQNGLLVFAANGIWFITGSQGIGFAANDYTITRISAIRSISSTSFVDLVGFPVFWNEEGIYYVSPTQDQGGGPKERIAGLQVINLALGTILSFYRDIPLASKKFVKGDYDPVNYTIQWVYRSTVETGISDRYSYDRVLNFNTSNKAFFPWTIATSGSSPIVRDIKYVIGAGGLSPDSQFKYFTSYLNAAVPSITYSEEWDSTHWKDWNTVSPINYNSFFVTGYKLHGQAQKKFQANYIYLYSSNIVNVSYKLQGIWDYAISGNSGKFTSLEQTEITELPSNFSFVHRRHRIRGRGLALQFRITSKDGAPFDIIGWSVDERLNQGV